MARDIGSSATGKPFSEDRIRVVWAKARAISDFDPDDYRLDDEDNLIRFRDHGQRTETGWEIDHVHPVALGGSDHLRNLRPLHWQANRRKGDSRMDGLGEMLRKVGRLVHGD